MSFIILVAILSCAFAEVIQNPDGSGGSIKFKAPDLNDEEQESLFMPDLLKCDSCHVVAYQIHEAFMKENNKRKSLKYKLPESDVIEMFEHICDTKTYENYGLKEVEGVKRLSGPGIEDTKDVPGIMQGGGKWPRRISDMCETYAGDIGEMELYQKFKENPANLSKFRKYLCHGKNILGECSKIRKASPKRQEKEEL